MEMKIIQDCLLQVIKEIEGPKVREELKKTPFRVAKAYKEIFDGYGIDTKELLSNQFEQDGADMIVAVRDIKFYSTCEHHLLTFDGIANVAYLPNNRKVVGVSKIERLVNVYAHRLQLQERITRQVAEDLMTYLEPRGVAVIIQAKHLCMRCRGVKSNSSQMVTSVMLGAFRDNQSARMEVLSLLGITK